MNNADMKPRRFERWAKARKLHKAITSHLMSGGVVQITTYDELILYKQEHVALFSCDKLGCYVQLRKRRVDIQGWKIRFGKFIHRANSQRGTD